MAEPRPFTLEIVTPAGISYRGTVTTLIAPAALGYLGILAHHAPLVATLTPGKITFRDAPGATRTLHNVGPGILEVRDNRVTILAEQVTA